MGETRTENNAETARSDNLAGVEAFTARRRAKGSGVDRVQTVFRVDKAVKARFDSIAKRFAINGSEIIEAHMREIIQKFAEDTNQPLEQEYEILQRQYTQIETTLPTLRKRILHLSILRKQFYGFGGEIERFSNYVEVLDRMFKEADTILPIGRTCNVCDATVRAGHFDSDIRGFRAYVYKKAEIFKLGQRLKELDIIMLRRREERRAAISEEDSTGTILQTGGQLEKALTAQSDKASIASSEAQRFVSQRNVVITAKELSEAFFLTVQPPSTAVEKHDAVDKAMGQATGDARKGN